MFENRGALLVIAFLACMAAGCSNPSAGPPDTRVQDEAAIRAADANWAQWAMARDLDKCMSVYADDAVVFAPGIPAVIGKDNIRSFLSGLVASPGLQLNFHVASVEVAHSGDIAIDRGTVDATMNDKKGQPVSRTSRYLLVWQKQADGSWKIQADTSANEK